MSPFMEHFHNLRRRYRISQGELAKKMGYEQGYISGLENGRKGPPNEEFVSKLIEALNLSEHEQVSLEQSVIESQRRFVLPIDAPIEHYTMMRILWQELEFIHPAQIRAINEILQLRERMGLPAHINEDRGTYNKRTDTGGDDVPR